MRPAGGAASLALQAQVSEALDRAYALALDVGEALRDPALRPRALELAELIDGARALLAVPPGRGLAAPIAGRSKCSDDTSFDPATARTRTLP